jgi:polysaccharide export outer membrane protein
MGLVVAAIAVSALTGCATTESRPPAASPSSAPYRIGPNDTVEVDVWKDGSLSAAMPVRPDGAITVPLAGDVRALGRTAQQIRHEIERRLRPTLRDPIVTVLVKDANSASFSVLGEVVHPGAFPLHGAVSVLDAIALAGGLTAYADGDQLVLLRSDRAGKSHRYELSYKQEIDGANPVPLSAGDVLVVP